MIKIKNMRYSQPTTAVWDVVCDRSSVLGNPIPLGNEMRRNKVCNEYHTYFHECMDPDSVRGQTEKAKLIRHEIAHLIALYTVYGKLNLYCWCKPRRCHVETIKSWIERAI
jgi:hypothetical protein